MPERPAARFPEQLGYRPYDRLRNRSLAFPDAAPVRQGEQAPASAGRASPTPRGALRIALAARAEGPWLRWNEPHAARAGAIEIVKLSIGYRGWNDDDHSGRNVHLTRRIQLPTIVGAVAARLHQHSPRQSQRPVQMQIRLNLSLIHI